MNKTLIKLLKFLLIFFAGTLISVYLAALMSTNKEEYVGIVMAIVFSGTLIFTALEKNNNKKA